jgi:hypothetical protein
MRPRATVGCCARGIAGGAEFLGRQPEEIGHSRTLGAELTDQPVVFSETGRCGR